MSLPPYLAAGASHGPTARTARKHSLLALHWPTAAELHHEPACSPADRAAWATEQQKAGKLFGVWDDVAGLFRYPTFQFGSEGCIYPRLPALLVALAEHPDRAAESDESGWRRAYWLYQPDRTLSRNALSNQDNRLICGLSEERTWEVLDALMKNDESPSDRKGRTPAEVFAEYPDAVIALALRSARMASPDADAEGNRLGHRGPKY